MIETDLQVAAAPDHADPAWVVLTAAFFHEDGLSRRGARRRVLLLAAAMALIVCALILEFA